MKINLPELIFDGSIRYGLHVSILQDPPKKRTILNKSISSGKIVYIPKTINLPYFTYIIFKRNKSAILFVGCSDSPLPKQLETLIHEQLYLPDMPNIYNTHQVCLPSMEIDFPIFSRQFDYEVISRFWHSKNGNPLMWKHSAHYSGVINDIILRCPLSASDHTIICTNK